jgi:hypothetical protein
VKRLTLLLAFLLSACLAQPTPEPTVTPRTPQILRMENNPYAPQLDDVRKVRAGIIITAVNLSERTDLNPSRIQVNFLGSMPSTCSELRLEVKPPNMEYQLHIAAYSLTDTQAKCENVFQQFETNILLGVYSPGRYYIWVNGEYIGDFVSY